MASLIEAGCHLKFVWRWSHWNTLVRWRERCSGGRHSELWSRALGSLISLFTSIIKTGFSSHFLASAPSPAASWLHSTACSVPEYLWSCIAWHIKFVPGFIKYRRAMDREAPLKGKDLDGFVTSCLRACLPLFLLAKSKYLFFCFTY